MVNKIKKAIALLRNKGAFDILCGTFLTRAAAFLGSIVLVRILSKQDYGILSSLENIYTYLYLLAGYGLNNALFRWVVLKDSLAEKKGIITYVISAGTAFNVSLVVCAALICFLFPIVAIEDSVCWMLPVMLFAIPFQFLFESGTFSLRALFMNRAYAVISLICVVLIWAFKVIFAQFAGLSGAVISWPAAYLLISAVLIPILLLRIFKNIRRSKPLKDDRHKMTKYALQYMLTNGLWVLFTQNDILMIGQLTANAEMVADYKVASVFPMILGLLSGSIGLFVGPYFIKHENEKRWIWANYKRVFFVSFFSIVFFALLLAIFSKSIVQFIYGEQYLSTVPLILCLLVSGIINNGARYVGANLIATMGKIKANMIVAAFGIVLQILLNLFLIPRFGVFGAALSGIIVQGFMAIAITVYFIKTYRI